MLFAKTKKTFLPPPLLLQIHSPNSQFLLMDLKKIIVFPPRKFTNHVVASAKTSPWTNLAHGHVLEYHYKYRIRRKGGYADKNID